MNGKTAKAIRRKARENVVPHQAKIEAKRIKTEIKKIKQGKV